MSQGWRRRIPKDLHRAYQIFTDDLERQGFDLSVTVEQIDPNTVSDLEGPDEERIPALMDLIDRAANDGIEWPERLPLVIVARKNEKLASVDGRHRILAAIELGRRTIPALVVNARTIVHIWNAVRFNPFEVYAISSELMDKNNDLRISGGEPNLSWA